MFRFGKEQKMNSLFSAIDREAFSIGNLSVEWYGLILTAAMIIGLIYILREGNRIKMTSDESLSLFLWIIPLAIIFARFVYVIVRPDEYLPITSWDDFVHFWAIWEGGITIVGGILGGILGGVIFCLIHKKNFGTMADLVIPALLLGQAIGRWGNFINQEAFGVAITNPALQWFPMAVYIDSPFAGQAVGWYAATFFYEMLWNLLGFGLMYLLWRKQDKIKVPGLLIFLYFAWYFFARGLLELIRLDAVILENGVRLTMVVSFVLVPIALIACIFYVKYCRKHYAVKALKELMKNGVTATEIELDDGSVSIDIPNPAPAEETPTDAPAGDMLG